MKSLVLMMSMALFVNEGLCSGTKEVLAKSPDGRNSIKLFLDPLAYEVSRDGVTVVSRTAISLNLKGETLSGEGKKADVSSGAYSGKLSTPVYKKSSIDLAANWTYADYGDWGVRLVARNDGVAYRFETEKPGKIKVTGEKACLGVPDPAAKCWINYTGNFGCEESYPLTMPAREITTHSKGRIGGWIGRRYIYLPFVYTVGGKAVAVTESDVFDYPVWNLVRPVKNDAVVFDACFSMWPAETTKGGRKVPVKKSTDFLVETDGTRTFPWRTFVLADASAMSAFCEADIVNALARPAVKGDDFSWVRPGKVAWDWWNDFDNKGGKGCTTATYKRFVDFAAKTGVEYVILDEGWSEKLNIWKYHPNVDVPAIVEYAKKKNVGIILWMAWAQAVGDEERVVRHFAKLGVKGFKVDFMDRSDAECERFLWKFAEECRKEKMLVDYHGSHRPTGMSRTYPNVINYEGIHGLEQMKWYGSSKYDFMANDVQAFYLRMTAGPMDYTPGAMDNYPVGAYKGNYTNPGSMGTRCRQMAMMAMYEAPLQMLCDSPTKYEKNMECFSFMAATPVVWDAAVGLGGCPDSYAAIARRAKDGSWYAAAITNAKGRDITIDTAKFLGSGEWKAEIFRDAPDSDKTPVKYIHETKSVKGGEKLKFHTAPGGGFVVKFTK